MTPAPENTPSTAAPPPPATLNEAWLERRRARIQRLKKWLRYIPRRTNMHRYPVLKWFASAARARSYLWSFRAREVVPAIYIGWLVTMIPVPIHMFSVLLLSFVIRSNLMVGWALVWITNPITFVPILYMNLHLGARVLSVFGVHIELDSFREMSHAEGFHWGQGAKDMLEMMNAMIVGGLITGFAGGFVTSVFYRHFAKKLGAEPRPAPDAKP